MNGPPAVGEAAGFLGRWRLAVGSDLPARDHALEIVHVDVDAACGYVSIDASGRDGDVDKEPDRRRHEVAFSAARRNGGLAFTVVVGAVMPRRYVFELYVVDGELCGIVDVRWDREGAVARRDGVRGARVTSSG